MSLYRKYRPHLFADVVGQEHVITTLEQAAKQDKLAHAYLFAGTRGTGKTSVARILAQHIMTVGLEDEAVIKQIKASVQEGNIVDLMEIDAASNRGIDDVRDLIEKIQFSPVVAAAKVYIIDEVHMLTKEAFNALLKTLEEPPEYAYFILATTELNKIPSTIRSRCQCFPFRAIREEDIIRRLQYIADQEHIKVDRDALRAIAHHVGGGMRDAISLLDQLRSLDAITLADVESRVGSSGFEHVEHVLEAIANQDSERMVTIVKELEDAGTALDVFMRELLSALREQLHESVADAGTRQRLTGMLDVLLDAIRNIRISPVPGVVLEAALLQLCEGEPVVMAAPTPKAKKEVKKEEPNVEPEKPAAEEVAEAEEVAAEPEPEKEEISEAIVEAPDMNMETLQGAWPDIVKQTSPASVRMSLKNGHLDRIEGNTIVVRFASEFHRDKVGDPEASKNIEDIMEKIFKQRLKISCETGADAAPLDDGDVVNLADAAAEVF